MRRNEKEMVKGNYRIAQKRGKKSDTEMKKKDK